MGTKANPGKYDCHAAADPEEPIFTLRANDPIAPLLVRRWAYLYRRLKEKTAEDGKLSSKAHRKYMEAHDCADAMERWRAEKHPKPEPKPTEAEQKPNGRS